MIRVLMTITVTAACIFPALAAGNATLNLIGSGSDQQLAVQEAPSGAFLPFLKVDPTSHRAISLPAALPGLCIPIDLYGADPAGVNFSDAAWAQAASSNSCVAFGAGLYKFAGQLTKNLSATAKDSISVYGLGPGVTKLYWPNGGGFQFNLNSDRNSFHVSDMLLLTGEANGSATSSAITASNNYCLGNLTQSTVRNVQVEGYDTATAANGAATGQGWAQALALTGVSSVSVESLSVILGNGILFRGEANSSRSNVDANGRCFVIQLDVTRSKFIGTTTGLTYGTLVQGVTVSQTNFTNGANGILVPTSSLNTDQLNVSDSQFDVTGNAIALNANILHTNIHNNLFFVYSGMAAIVYANGSWHAAHSNIILSHPGQPSANGIQVVSNASGNAGVIQGNVFESLAIGVGLASGSSGWNVQGNAYSGVTSPTVNSGTGNNVGTVTP